MPQATSIVLADAQATPVNHTFDPSGPDANNVYLFVNRDEANPIAFEKIMVSLKEPGSAQPGTSANGRTYKVQVDLVLPVLETAGDSSSSGILPAPTLAYAPRFRGEFLISERSTLQDRKDLAKMAALLLQNALVKAVIENLDRIRG